MAATNAGKPCSTNGRLARACLLAALAGLLSGVGGFASAQTTTNSPQGLSVFAAQERDACARNLKVIYDAIQAYKTDNKRLPNWLSDLVPQYLSDANVLVCPACLRTGHLESSGVADPTLPCSYLYEFSVARLGDAAPNAPGRTRRELRERQMALIGPVVPIVRCRHHKQILNLAFDGNIYDSGVSWEGQFTNQAGVAALSAARLFADVAAQPTGVGAGTNANASSQVALPPSHDHTEPAKTIPQHRGSAHNFNGIVFLTKYYNAALTNSWLGGLPGDDLSSLPPGRQIFGGVQFNVRGIIQLAGKTIAPGAFPAQVKSIPVHRKCAALHFLHAAASGAPGDEGLKIGSYVIHFATNQMRLELPIIYGHEVRDWHAAANEPQSDDLKLAWTGVSRPGDSARPIRLFMTTWTNVAPSVEIERIDFSSTMNGPAPFLIAITAE